MEVQKIEVKGNVIQCTFEDDVKLNIAVNIEFEVVKVSKGVFIITSKRSKNTYINVGDSFSDTCLKVRSIGYLLPSVESKEASWIL